MASRTFKISCSENKSKKKKSGRRDKVFFMAGQRYWHTKANEAFAITCPFFHTSGNYRNPSIPLVDYVFKKDMDTIHL